MACFVGHTTNVDIVTRLDSRPPAKFVMRHPGCVPLQVVEAVPYALPLPNPLLTNVETGAVGNSFFIGEGENMILLARRVEPRSVPK